MSNSNQSRGNYNLNNFKLRMNNLRKRNINPYNARKNNNNAIREDFESVLGLKPGWLNMKHIYNLSVEGRNYKNDDTFFKALINENVNAGKRLCKMIYT
mgnify:CR=1 FL=1